VWVIEEHNVNLVIAPHVEPTARSRRKRVQFPYCAVIGENSELDKSDQREYTGLVHNITIEIGDTGVQPDLLDQVMKLRVHAISAVLERITEAELMGGTDWAWGIPDLSIIAQNYQMSSETVEGVYVALAEITVEVGVNQQ